DASLVALKARRFAASGLPALLGRAATAAEAACVRDAFDVVLAAIEAAPRRLAHRDYQSRNLLVRPPDANGHRLVMIDLQGAARRPAGVRRGLPPARPLRRPAGRGGGRARGADARRAPGPAGPRDLRAALRPADDRAEGEGLRALPRARRARRPLLAAARG